MGAQGMAALAVVVILFGGVIALPAQPVSATTPILHLPGTSDSLAVAATKDYGYSPPTFEQVPTNATINVTFTDDSNLPHTFTIIGKEGWVVPGTISATDFSNLVFGQSPPVMFNLNVTAMGDVAMGSFQSRGPGWYEFVCTTSGHFQSGMYGFIAFGENLPANLTPNSRVGVGGGNIGLIEAASAGAVLVVILIGVVVWRRRRRGHRTPPESE
jgi:plastocyanin